MKHLLVGLSLALASASPAMGQTWPYDIKSEDAINRTVQAYVDAWNRADARALGERDSLSGDYTGFGSVMTRGREEIVRQYQNAFAHTFAGCSTTIDISSIRFLKPDVAVVDGTLALSNVRATDGT